MKKMIATAVLAAAAGMTLSVSPVQAQALADHAAARGTGTDPNPLGNLLQTGPVSLPETLLHLLPTE
ncbi:MULTISPECIES: hypothetical protein [Streptomyces]|uniref:hypothetical protein n=1 Tax=Streptomyces TaxID=1883 RepID=UPI0029A744D5|nr:hypothetical protein [Streptomyces sp. WI03-4A]MDX2592999.1 hypothetical protein [Streptomyces sp. WI03-4A]